MMTEHDIERLYRDLEALRIAQGATVYPSNQTIMQEKDRIRGLIEKYGLDEAREMFDALDNQD
jgi:hypothetical protein